MHSLVALAAEGAVNSSPASGNYPILVGVTVAALTTAGLVFFAGHFDPTRGPLTISLLITLGMLGTTAYCLIYAIPPDDITTGVVSGLTTGFGAVLTYWFGRATRDPPPPPPPPP